MTQEELWIIYVRKNPRFVERDARICFTPPGLRKFFEQTYLHAYNTGKMDASQEEEYVPKAGGDTADIFKSLFGGTP